MEPVELVRLGMILPDAVISGRGGAVPPEESQDGEAFLERLEDEFGGPRFKLEEESASDGASLRIELDSEEDRVMIGGVGSE